MKVLRIFLSEFRVEYLSSYEGAVFVATEEQGVIAMRIDVY